MFNQEPIFCNIKFTCKNFLLLSSSDSNENSCTYCLYGRIAYYIVVSKLLLGHGPRPKRLSMRALFCDVWHVCRVSCLLIEHTMDVVEARAAVVLIATVSSGDVDLVSISMDASVHHDRYQFVLTAPLSQCFRTVSTF